MMKFFKNNAIDFISKFTLAKYISLIFIILGLLLFLVKGPELGIDFKGGTELIIKLDSGYKNKDNIIKYLNENNIKYSSIKSYGSNKVRVLFESESNQKFMNDNFNIISYK